MRSFLGEIQYPIRAIRAIASLMWNSYMSTKALQATTGNTALMFFQNRMYALMEAALPIQVDPETLKASSSLSTLDGVLTTSLTAHPKFDLEADEMIAFGYIPPASSLSYFVLKGGKAVYQSKIEFAENQAGKLYARMPHDFAVSKHFTIFFDTPAIRMHPGIMLGLPVPKDPTPARLVWFRRKSNVTSFVTVETGSVFHFAGAFEEGSKLTIIGKSSHMYNETIREL